MDATVVVTGKHGQADTLWSLSHQDYDGEWEIIVGPRQAGYDQARADLVFFINAGDIAPPDWLRKFVAGAEANQDAVFFQGRTG